jgi:hypothetical protein
MKMERPDGSNFPPYLMVGGPADGKFVQTETNRVAVPKSRAAPVLVWDKEYAENVAFEVVEYHKLLMCGGDVAVFIPVNETPYRTMLSLIQGYHQPKETT